MIKWLKENGIKNIAPKLNVSTDQREFFKNKIVYRKIVDMIKNGILVKTNILNFEAFNKKYLKYLTQSELGNSFFIWKVINAEYFLKAFR